MSIKKTKIYINNIHTQKKNNNRPNIEDSKKIIREKNILYFIREIAKALVSARSIEDMSKMVYDFLKESYGNCSIGLAVNYPKEKKISDCFFFENNERLYFEDILYSEGDSSKLLKAVLNKKEYIYEEKTRTEPLTYIGKVPLASYFTPLIIEKDVIGAFTFQIYERDSFSVEEIEVCRELTPFMTIALHNTIQNKKILMANKILEKYSKYDDLTGIYNRRSFYKYFDMPYQKAILKDENTFLYLLDLNNFKGVNDNFGHFAGDEVLINVAEVLKKLFSKKGEVGRYGGDEFLCGITNISKENAIKLAEVIVKEIDKLNIPYNLFGEKVGISIGIIELKSKKSLESYFLDLDKNLYKAKKSLTLSIVIS